jgi:hypothetical protein
VDEWIRQCFTCVKCNLFIIFLPDQQLGDGACPMRFGRSSSWPIEPDLRPLPCGVAAFADTPREIVVRFPQYHSANVAFDPPHRRH